MTIQAKQVVQQRLLLAPNVTLALEILRMPTLELRAFLELQLEDNPFLELDLIEEEPPQTTQSESEGPIGASDDWAPNSISGEWEAPDDGDGADRYLEQRLVVPQSMDQSLRVQLGCQQMPPEERKLGELIIGHLNESGYLEAPLEQLAVETQLPLERAEAVLRQIQRFDPPGVGARDLRECLMIQLEQTGACGSLAHRILKDHFELFIKHRLPQLAKATGAAMAQVSQACECLRRLNPKPGRVFSGELPPSVIPDLVISHQEHHYDVELNDQDMPHVGVNRAYYRMLKDARTPSDAKEFLASKFQKASWLIKAIEERNATLLAIARCLISLQREFLEYGPQAIKPLTQAQVAHLIGRHPSTVSRAIAGKTIDSPFGVYRLEELFASGVPQSNDAATVSDERIKSEIQRLIAAEDPQHPLSDAALAKHLSEQQVMVARRTIAKYRTALKVLPAHLRRRRF